MSNVSQFPVQIKEAEVPEAMFRLVNPLLKLLLNSPLHSLVDKQLMLLRWQGRKSGNVYTTPVGYKQDGNRIIVFTFSGWQANFRQPHPVEMRLRGIWRSGTGLIDDDPRDAASFIKQSVADGDRGAYRRFRMAVEGTREPTIEELVPEVKKRNMVLIKIKLNS